MSKKEKDKTSDAPKLETTIKRMITYTCPVRGVVTQEVLVKKFEKQKAPEDKQVDSALSELLNSELTELEDAGFHEEKH